MWCYTKKNGTVLCRERYKDPLTGKDKVMSVSKPKDTPQNKNKAHSAGSSCRVKKMYAMA